MGLFAKNRGSKSIQAAMAMAQAQRSTEAFKDFGTWAADQGFSPQGLPEQASLWTLVVGRMSLTAFPAFGLGLNPKLEYILLTARHLDTSETWQIKSPPNLSDLEEWVDDFRVNAEDDRLTVAPGD